MELLTHTRMTTARTCMRKHWLMYELGVRPDRDSTPLRFGSAMHLGMDKGAEAVIAAYETPPAWVDTAERLADWQTEAYTVLALLAGYHAYYAEQGIDEIQSEQQFEIPLVYDGRTKRGWRIAGKMDKIIRLADTRKALMEHKTTGDPIDDGSKYWQRLRLDQQISLYMMAARSLGHDVQTVVYDVIRKPTVDRHLATPVEKRKYTKAGVLYANQRAEDETPEEYNAWLQADIAEHPEEYFARKEVPRIGIELAECYTEVGQTHAIIMLCRKHHAWPRNTSACTMYGQCPYFAICSMGINPEAELPAGFVRTDKIHPELEDTNAPA